MLSRESGVEYMDKRTDEVEEQKNTQPKRTEPVLD